MRSSLTAYGFLLGAFLLLGSAAARMPDQKLHVVLLDVGQGDAILVTTPGNQRVLIDGGPDLSALERLGEELPFFSRTIDLLLLSHTDADHITALPEVLRRYEVQRVMFTGVAADTAVYQAFLDAVRASGAEVILGESASDLALGDGVLLDVLWPIGRMLGEHVKEPNNAGIVAKLTWKDHEILLTGDIEEKVEEALLRAGVDLRADVLKVPHHGSKTSSSTGFLLAVAPELAVISVGRENSYGHPHPSILGRYASLGIPVRRTDAEGTVELLFE